MQNLLLKEYIRQVLFLQEAKIDDVKAKYPALVSLISVNFSGLQPKYLEWSAKILSQDPVQETAEEIRDLIQTFDELVSRNQIKGSQRDINSFKSLEDLSSLVSSFEGQDSERQKRLATFREKRTQAVQDSIPIFEDENIFIVVPLSQKASCFYGSGKWCIAYTKARNAWEEYTLSEEMGFVFIFDKTEMVSFEGSESVAKYALVVDEMGRIKEVRDSFDELVFEDLIFKKFAAYQTQIEQGIQEAKKTFEIMYAKKEEEIKELKIELEDRLAGTGAKIEIDIEKNILISNYKGKLQSFQDPKTQEWMPAEIYFDGTKYWRNQNSVQSFQDPETGEWMPAIIYADGGKRWYDKGNRVEDPKIYFKDLGGIQR